MNTNYRWRVTSEREKACLGPPYLTSAIQQLSQKNKLIKKEHLLSLIHSPWGSCHIWVAIGIPCPRTSKWVQSWEALAEDEREKRIGKGGQRGVPVTIVAPLKTVFSTHRSPPSGFWQPLSAFTPSDPEELGERLVRAQSYHTNLGVPLYLRVKSTSIQCSSTCPNSSVPWKALSKKFLKTYLNMIKTIKDETLMKSSFKLLQTFFATTDKHLPYQISSECIRWQTGWRDECYSEFFSKSNLLLITHQEQKLCLNRPTTFLLF